MSELSNLYYAKFCAADDESERATSAHEMTFASKSWTVAAELYGIAYRAQADADVMRSEEREAPASLMELVAKGASDLAEFVVKQSPQIEALT